MAIITVNNCLEELKSRFIYEFNLMNFRSDDENTGYLIMTRLDDFIKNNIAYFVYIFQYIKREYKDGCLIISTGTFGVILKEYLESIKVTDKYPIVVFNIRNYDGNSKNEINLSKEDIIKIEEANKIMFVDDSYSTGRTFLKSKEIIANFNKNVSGGYIFNFTGYRVDNIEPPLKYFVKLKDEISKMIEEVSKRPGVYLSEDNPSNDN